MAHLNSSAHDGVSRRSQSLVEISAFKNIRKMYFLHFREKKQKQPRPKEFRVKFLAIII